MHHASRLIAVCLWTAVSISSAFSAASAADMVPVPISYYDFDEPNGSGTLTDSIRGAAGLGTIRNANGDPVNGSFVPGIVGSAMQFAGSTYVVMNTATGGTQYTVSSWVYLNAATTWATIVKNWGSALPGALHLGLGDNTGRLTNFIGNTNNAVFAVEDPSTAAVGQWVHVASTFNGATGINEFKLYVNAQHVDTSTASGEVNNFIPLMSMGVKLGNNTNLPSNADPGWLNGLLDEIAFWDVALTPTQITTIYTDGLGGTSPIPVPEPSTYALSSIAAGVTVFMSCRRNRR